MKLNTLNDLLVSELKDLYSAETQLLKALPRMAKSAKSPSLKQAFEEHTKATEEHRNRLEQILSDLDASPRGRKCAGMEGLIEESKEIMEMDGDAAVHDAALIAAAQRVEHYEIAAYGTARTYANMLGMSEAARLLQTTLDEEEATDQKLTDIAESEVNQKAAQH